MSKLEYVYDHRHDIWCAMWDGDILVSISRDKVLQFKEDKYQGRASEMSCFKDMFAEVLLSELEHEDNAFLVGAVLTRLFENVMN